MGTKLETTKRIQRKRTTTLFIATESHLFSLHTLPTFFLIFLLRVRLNKTSFTLFKEKAYNPILTSQC